MINWRPVELGDEITCDEREKTILDFVDSFVIIEVG